MNRKTLFWSVVAAAQLAAVATDALAQTAVLEEVVVTARKREESLLEVPVTVTAFTAESMETRSITDLNKVVDFTPSFYLASNNGGVASRATSVLTIRGISGGAQTGAAKGVSIFIDGSPAGSGVFDTLENIERVEVLKGPQATYFGRATFAGAINLVTKTPGNEFKGSAEVLVGSNEHREIKGSLMGPIIQDKLGFTLSARDYSFGGDYKNFASYGGGGGTYDRLGAQSTKSVSAGLNVTPFDGLSIKANGTMWSTSDGPAAFGQYRNAQYNCNARATAGAFNYLCGTLPALDLSRLASVTPVDAIFTNYVLNDVSRIQGRTFNDNDPYIDHGGLELRGWHAGTQINYEIPAIGATATLLGGANAVHSGAIYDFGLRTIAEAGANPNFPAVPNTERYNGSLFYWQRRFDDKSAEFRLTSDQDQRFRWVTGASYFTVLSQQSTAGLVATGPARFTQGAPIKSKTSGVFLGLSYDILDSLTLDLEGRYQWDKLQAFSRPLTSTVYPFPVLFVTEGTYKNFVPRVNLSYNVTQNTMVYALWSVGLNPGQFNSNIISAAPFQLTYLQGLGGGTGIQVRPEKLDNYELGVKSKFWDGRAQLSANVYYAKWTDQAVSNTVFVPRALANGQPANDGSSQPFTLVQNIGLSEIKGVEVDGAFAVTDHLTVNVSGAYNGSEIKEFVCLACVATTGSTNVIGHRLPNQPAVNSSAGLEFKDALTDSLDYFLRSDVIYKGRIYDTVANTVHTPDAWRANFRAGISTERYRIEAFLTNAFDDLTPTAIENNTDALAPFLTAGRAVNVTLPQRRQIGVRASYNFF